MTRSPASVIHALFGDIAEVTILGKAVNLLDLVRIPDGADLEELLHENAERRALWGRVLSKCRAAVDKADDDLEHERGVLFHQYWRTLEDREREEMRAEPLDEDVVVDQFRRRKVLKRRVDGGSKTSVGRWRRNFSDDLVWSLVHSDDRYQELKKILRKARAQLEVVYGVRDALDVRAKAVMQLAAIQRDNTRH